MKPLKRWYGIEGNEVKCIYFDLTAVSLTMSYATSKLMLFLHKRSLMGEESRIKIGVTNIFEECLT